MEGAAHAAETRSAVYHNDLGGGKGLARGELPGEIEIVDAHNETGLSVLSDLSSRCEIPGIHEIEAEDLAAVLIGLMLTEGGEGIILMRALAANGIDRLFPVMQTAALDGTFSCPGAVEGDHIELIGIEVHAGGIDP